MMTTVTLFGASGAIGTAIGAELIRRGHAVIAVSRSGSKTVDGTTVREGDATDPTQVADLVAASQVIAVATGPRHDGADDLGDLSRVAMGIVDGARRANVARLVIVGGAGNLVESGGEAHSESDLIKDEYRDRARAQARAFSEIYAQADDLDWTYVSPATEIFPGSATGSYRTGGQQLVRDEQGHHRISIGDYAVGFVDVIEQTTHRQAQITFAY